MMCTFQQQMAAVLVVPGPVPAEVLVVLVPAQALLDPVPVPAHALIAQVLASVLEVPVPS